MTLLAALFDFSIFKLNWGNPLVFLGIIVALIALCWYLVSKKKEEEVDAASDASPSSTPAGPSDLKESLRSLANVVNFIGVADGAVILTDLAAGDYSHAPRAARALATKLDTPEGRKELIRRVIDKHAHSFADDPAIVSRFASVMAKQKR
jgi:hypothetical protein